MKKFNITFKEPIVENIVLKEKLSSLKVTLKKTIIQADTTIRSIPLRLYAVVKNKLLLKHEVFLSMHKLTGVHHAIGLKQSVATALRTIFDKAYNAIGLYTDEPADTLLTKTIKDIFHKMHLTSSEVGAVWNKIAGKGSNVMRFVQHAATGELWVAAGKGENKMLLKEPDSLEVSSTKHETAQNKLLFKHAVFAEMGKPVGVTPNIMSLTSSVNAYFARLRLLGEMDSNGTADLLLAEFDGMTLEDVDFIII